MPQKKNPVRYITACSGQQLATYICEITLQDSLELLRGKSGRVFGQVSDTEQCHGASWWLIVVHSSDGGLHDDHERNTLHLQQGFPRRQGASV